MQVGENITQVTTQNYSAVVTPILHAVTKNLTVSQGCKTFNLPRRQMKHIRLTGPRRLNKLMQKSRESTPRGDYQYNEEKELIRQWVRTQCTIKSNTEVFDTDDVRYRSD